jgi:protein SCO1/2
MTGIFHTRYGLIVNPKRTFAALSVGLLVSTAACGGDDVALLGLVRNDPLDVGHVTMTEERIDSDPRQFAFIAPPGELLVVFFGYTFCPDICPSSLSDLRAALKRIGTDAIRVNVAFVTIDPERDTVDRLDAFIGSYVTRYHTLRTLDGSELTRVKEAFLASSTVTTNDDGQPEVSHTATMYVVDDAGRVVDELPFGLGADGMENDLRILLSQAKRGSS